MPEKTPYLEAMRYLDNARKTLSSSAGKEGKFYTDRKYVRMASHTAYTGVLLCLKAFLNLNTNVKERDNVSKYREALGKRYPNKLKDFNAVYDTLHLAGGYDGNLSYDVIQTGLKIAEELIEWTKPVTNSDKFLKK
jgi:hypothetical protein